MRCTQSRDLPFGVSASEEIEAVVMEASESTSLSEKMTWMVNKTGNVVKVCKSANHPVEGSGSALPGMIPQSTKWGITYNTHAEIERRGWRQSLGAPAFAFQEM